MPKPVEITFIDTYVFGVCIFTGAKEKCIHWDNTGATDPQSRFTNSRYTHTFKCKRIFWRLLYSNYIFSKTVVHMYEFVLK